MQDATTPPTCQDACLECMQEATSCLVDPLSVACAETPRAWSIHLVLLHVRLHVQLPCTATPRASGDTQLVRCLTPRSKPMQQATSGFSVGLRDFLPFRQISDP
uniref:Uncharacterized protein n=1 Tax=Brassica oleracea var. oleracea TaxID=109376 RepID=A0A0D3CM66_BRAOL